MKILRIVLLVLMVAFALVQLNDPDGAWWMAVYGAVALMLALAVWRRSWVAGPFGRLASLSLVAALVVLVILHWPQESGFWHADVWWETETAREGMGLMSALFASLFVLPVALGGARRRPAVEP